MRKTRHGHVEQRSAVGEQGTSSPSRVGAHARVGRVRATRPRMRAPGVPLHHVRARAPILGENPAAREDPPQRSRTDFKTDLKAPPPLQANVSALSRSYDPLRWLGGVLEGNGRQDEVGWTGEDTDDGTWVWNLCRYKELTSCITAGASATDVSQ